MLCFSVRRPFRPFVGILVWCWISFMNPHRLVSGFGSGSALGDADLPGDADRLRDRSGADATGFESHDRIVVPAVDWDDD